MNANQTGAVRRAVGYVRVSTRDQAENGHSLEAQRAKVNAYATLHDMELTETIIDDGYSGKSLERPGMVRLLAMIQRKAVDVVVVAKLDRVTRSVRDLGELVERFQRSGVEFASVADNIDTATASGRLVLNVMASVAQWERETIAERSAEIIEHLRSKGRRISRFAPFGYQDAGNGDWIEDPAEQAVIGTILELRGRHLSLNRIGRELASRGQFGRSRQPLTPKVIASVLRRLGEPIKRPARPKARPSGRRGRPPRVADQASQGALAVDPSGLFAVGFGRVPIERVA